MGSETSAPVRFPSSPQARTLRRSAKAPASPRNRPTWRTWSALVSGLGDPVLASLLDRAGRESPGLDLPANRGQEQHSELPQPATRAGSPPLLTTVLCWAAWTLPSSALSREHAGRGPGTGPLLPLAWMPQRLRAPMLRGAHSTYPDHLCPSQGLLSYPGPYILHQAQAWRSQGGRDHRCGGHVLILDLASVHTHPRVQLGPRGTSGQVGVPIWGSGGKGP